MKKFSNFVVKNRVIILFISVLLVIPSVIGYIGTKTNYDILVYLPSDIETLKGQNILKDDFGIGAFSVSLVDRSINPKDLIELENQIRQIDGVSNVVSINDLTGTTIPLEMIPEKILKHVSSSDSILLLITFKTGTSDEETTDAVKEIEALSSRIKVGGMSAMSLDMRRLVESQTFAYVAVAVVFCFIVLLLSLDSYLVPFLLLGNIGLSILFNMGTNIVFGEISYITKAIAAVLQLGVTTDFSIFLYHKYEAAKEKKKSKDEAMCEAICETMVSVVGSSLTTIAGFLALCTMKFGLGNDIGLVMAKGVVFGVLTVLTVYPSLLLLFDRFIQKTKHKPLIPKFKFVSPIVMKNYKWIFLIFLILLVPAYLSQKNTEVYYKLDTSIPEDYNYSIVSKKLMNEYGLISQSMILVDANIKNQMLNQMIDEIDEVKGIDSVISLNMFCQYGISTDMLPSKIRNLLETDRYRLILVNSQYEIATDELNEQIVQLNTIVKNYDKNAILAGEGPLMNDLVEITAVDFRNVNYVSIGVIFIIMFFVLKSFSLPVLLVLSIEFAIFINMGVPYWQGKSIPFVSSIVIGTIQLGATIDYAILLTTKYLAERKSGKDKKEAVGEALNSSVSSIFVSAMCFFAATFAVFAISKIDMIGSLCLLMSRGAVISMVVVMFVVPSVLLMFDKMIIKTTVGFKKGKSL
ncbi:MAG: MMPL family transporter [Bacilli bacterium]|nr:MMPL family transporter [Bacilli bacterium]